VLADPFADLWWPADSTDLCGHQVRVLRSLLGPHIGEVPCRGTGADAAWQAGMGRHQRSDRAETRSPSLRRTGWPPSDCEKKSEILVPIVDSRRPWLRLLVADVARIQECPFDFHTSCSRLRLGESPPLA